MNNANRKPPPTNKPSTLLSEYENSELFNLLGKRCFTLATAVVQVFLAHPHAPKTWSKEHCGVACFVKDNPKRSYFIRVYDIVKSRMVWEQELYNQFKYQTPKQFYHVFATEDCWAGLNFANDQEANNFKRTVTEKIHVKQQRKQDTFRRSNSKEERKRQAPNVPSHSRPNNSAPPPPAVQHHGSSRWSSGSNTYPRIQDVRSRAPAPAAVNNYSTGTSKKKEKKEKKGKKSKLTKADIGTPQDFKHVSHVGWDPEKGFDVDEMDPQVKDWFQTIGVSEDQLRDQNTAAFIKDFIDSHGGIDEIKKDVERMGPITQSFTGGRSPGRDLPPPPPPSRGGQPPPPPPPARGSMPPPPPPAHVSHQRAAAPPPPPPSRGPAPPPPPSHASRTAAPPPPSRGLPPPPPPAPSRPAAAAPPPPPPMGGGGGGPPPPPPPPPPSDFPAAPPPPPAPTMGGGGGGGGGRSDLLSQIQRGAKLKTVDQNEEREKKAPTDARGALLNQIQQGVGLKPVSPGDDKDDEPIPMDGIGMALLTALQKRQHAIQSDDDADSDEDDDFDDDDEWDD